MILATLIIVLLAGGVLAWWAERGGTRWPRWITLVTLLIDLAWLAGVALQGGAASPAGSPGAWMAFVDWAWIPRFAIRFELGLDGLSLALIVLTLFLGATGVVASWREIRERVGFFHFNLLWTLAGVVGVFLALDLFLFFFFWELMLVPMYFLIAIWGHEHRRYAAIKFFIFTQASGLLMLAAIVALVLVHRHATGTYTFDYLALLGTPMGAATGMWIMLGFFVAFAVKLPAVPFHTWLPDAHTEAPTAGSVILAGVLLKTGAYGLLRFVTPLFPEAAHAFTPVAMALGAIGVIYGGIQAFAQTDLKRLVAYSSVSHLGFVLLGIFAWNALALQGAVMQMIAHGISTGALFILVGALQERLHTREMAQMGGLWGQMPRLAAIGLFFAIASLGLPGLGNFIGELLILVGSFRVSVVLTVLAAAGLVTAVAYALILVQKTFHGPPREGPAIPDLGPAPLTVMAAMMAIVVWLGLYPQPVLDTLAPALGALQRIAGG